MSTMTDHTELPYGSPKYEARDIDALEPHYSAHGEAMTWEGLDSKWDIAAELAWRDAEIERLLGLIGAHNAQCIQDCEAKSSEDCQPPYCTDCAKGWLIDHDAEPKSEATRPGDIEFGEEKPGGFIARCCFCGTATGAMDYKRTDQYEAARILGEWLFSGKMVIAQVGDFSEMIGSCECPVFALEDWR